MLRIDRSTLFIIIFAVFLVCLFIIGTTPSTVKKPPPRKPTITQSIGEIINLTHPHPKSSAIELDGMKSNEALKPCNIARPSTEVPKPLYRDGHDGNYKDFRSQSELRPCTTRTIPRH